MFYVLATCPKIDVPYSKIDLSPLLIFCTSTLHTYNSFLLKSFTHMCMCVCYTL